MPLLSRGRGHEPFTLTVSLTINMGSTPISGANAKHHSYMRGRYKVYARNKRRFDRFDLLRPPIPNYSK